jgi:hypothetical protein
MSDEFAGCDGNQSGQRFLDSSAPRLIRHVTSCETAGGGITPLPAGKDEKLSRGVGQRPAESGALRPVSTSLDEVQTNRDSPKSRDTHEGSNPGWKKGCARWTARGKSSRVAGKARYCRIGCKRWKCCGCGPRRAAMYRARILKTAERLKLVKLLTLTLDPKKLAPGEDSTEYINRAFADFRVYLRRKLGKTPTYIRVLEYQKNGNAHFHILLSRNTWLSQEWLSANWQAVGGGQMVDIRCVDLHRVSHYLSKYLTKQMIVEAPDRARRVTTSRDIKLLEKEAGEFSDWCIVRASIFQIYSRCRAGASATYDGDGYLLAFDIVEGDDGAGIGPREFKPGGASLERTESEAYAK